MVTKAFRSKYSANEKSESNDIKNLSFMSFYFDLISVKT